MELARLSQMICKVKVGRILTFYDFSSKFFVRRFCLHPLVLGPSDAPGPDIDFYLYPKSGASELLSRLYLYVVLEFYLLNVSWFTWCLVFETF